MSRRPFRLVVCVLVVATACTAESESGTTETQSSTTDSGSGTIPATESTVTTATAPPPDLSDLPGRLVVIDPGGDIVTIDPDGSDATPMTDDAGEAALYRQPTFSPAADRLAWAELTSDGAGLGSSDAAGEDRISVAMSSLPFFTYWSPDGSRIGVLHNGTQGSIEFEIVDVEAATAEVLATGTPFYFSWSPESSQVAVHVELDSFATLDLEGNVTDLGATAIGYQAPHWTPAGIIHLGADEIELRQVDGSARALATTPGPVAFVANRQGTRLAVQFFVAGATPGIEAALGETPELPPNRVMVIDVETGELSDVVDSPSIGLFWSPDGESLLVLRPSSNRPGELATIVWRDGESTELSTIAPHPAFVEEVLQFFDQYGQSLQLWSPDSSAFALVGAVEGDSGVWVHPVEGGDPVDVYEGSWVSWSGT